MGMARHLSAVGEFRKSAVVIGETADIAAAEAVKRYLTFDPSHVTIRIADTNMRLQQRSQNFIISLNN